MPMDPKKIIFLVRHGETAYNQKDILQGRMDNPLNDVGEKQASALAEVLQDEPIDQIFTSPQSRARQTAEIISQNHSARIEVIENFVEVDLGDWEGQIYAEVIQMEKDFHRRWQKDPSIPFPGGESFCDVVERTRAGVETLMKSESKCLLVAGHATVNRTILGHLMGLSPQVARRFRMRNCGLSKLLTYSNPHGDFTVIEFWNNYEHIRNLV